MRKRVLPLFAAVLFAAGACATGGMGTSSNRDLITAQDIVAAGNLQTAYDAVLRLEPQWFSARGSNSFNGSVGETPDVYMSGMNMGGVEYLHNVNATDVQQMRFYDVGEASTRFGMGHHSGVIELTLKGGE